MTVNIKTISFLISLFAFFFGAEAQKLHERDTITLSPNPASEYIIIHTKNYPSNAAFVDGNGLIQGFIPISGPRTRIDIQKFSTGNYFILLDGESHRFIKE